jgi:hypothetical protein
MLADAEEPEGEGNPGAWRGATGRVEAPRARAGYWDGRGREFGINGESSGKDGVNTNGDHRWYSLSYVG